MKKSNVICDLDGTIACDKHRNHFLHPPHKPDCKKILPDPLDERDTKSACNCGWKRDWESYFAACGSDEPVWPVINLLNMLNVDLKIHILSGRSNSTRAETIKWLAKHGVPYNTLILRPEGNKRDDHFLKIEQARYMDLGPDVVEFVLEDRQRVVDAWRNAGYTCLQVASGNF